MKNEEESSNLERIYVWGKKILEFIELLGFL
jgi:hypothetical protein